MKKIAKATSLLLAMIFMFSGLTVSVFAAGEDELTVNVYDGFAVVSACRQTASGIIDIPSEKNGVPVTQISDGAFSDCNKITQVYIPESVTKVGKNAFDSCVALEKITFAGTECTLGESAFAHCSALTDIALPSSLKEIPESAFYDCGSLTAISIPDTVETIGKEAFNICIGITKFDIPASVNYIGKNAFIGCTSATAYNVAEENAIYSSVDGVLYGPYSSSVTDKTLIQYPVGKNDASFTVQAGTLVIGDNAFGASKSLVSVTLPDGLKKIDSYAFNECKALASVNIPSTVTKIGSLAFGKCTALKEITIPASVTDFGSAFYMSGLTCVTIENGVKTVSAKAFEGCTALESVVLPTSVEKIDFGAFDGCSALKTVEIPESVTAIGMNAFAGCSAIKLVVVKDSYAHTYAESNSINYEFKGSDVPENPSTTKPTEKPSDPKPTTPSTTKKTIISVSVEKLPAKTNYIYKEAIDASGLELEVVYSDGSREIVKEGYKISPATCTERGTQTVTVEYEGITAEFNISVSFTWWQWIIWILALGFLWY